MYFIYFIYKYYIYIYVCVIYIYYSIQFKPELGVIPSGQENHSEAEYLNFPGRLNITGLLQILWIKYFFFVFLVYIRNTKQDGNKFIILK